MAAQKRSRRVTKTIDRESAAKVRLDPKSILSPAALSRTIRRSVRNAVRQEIASLRGKDWLSPQQPVGTFRPEDQASDWRSWDYPPGYNVVTTPRKYEPYNYTQLRWLARNLDLLREVIERRKNEVAMLPWDIVVRRGMSAEEDEILAVKEMLRYPDGETAFTGWQNALLEDMLVIDGPTVYPWPAKSGRIIRLVAIDGATINVLIDEYGRIPDPPDPAYQQVIQGMPYEFFARDELVYVPRNVRSGSPYGFSPVEQLVTSVAIALKLETRQLYYYSEGTIPDALIGVPESWTGKQLAQFQSYWDNLLRGNLQLRSGGVRFVPGGMKEVAFKNYEFNLDQWEWLARMICAAFHVNPQPYVRSNNRATAETAQAEQLQEGLEPTKIWWKALMDLLIERYLGKPNLEWAWKDVRDTDAVEQANADASDIQAGIKAPNEVRVARGMDPYDGFGDEPIILTGSGPVLLRSVYEASDGDSSALSSAHAQERSRDEFRRRKVSLGKEENLGKTSE